MGRGWGAHAGTGRRGRGAALSSCAGRLRGWVGGCPPPHRGAPREGRGGGVWPLRCTGGAPPFPSPGTGGWSIHASPGVGPGGRVELWMKLSGCRRGGVGWEGGGGGWTRVGGGSGGAEHPERRRRVSPERASARAPTRAPPRTWPRHARTWRRPVGGGRAGGAGGEEASPPPPSVWGAWGGQGPRGTVGPGWVTARPRGSQGRTVQGGGRFLGCLVSVGWVWSYGPAWPRGGVFGEHSPMGLTQAWGARA